MTVASAVPLAELPPERLSQWLATGRLGLHTGPFTFRIQAHEPVIADNLRQLYGAHRVTDSPTFSDFHVSVARPGSLRRWFAPQVEFRLDGYAPFYSLPAPQAFAMLEWGMNWCIASSSHRYLMLHSAVLARDGRAVLLPGTPGAGKSTLCASMALSGWRLLSDELALIDPRSGQVFGLARPINLKNASIDIIRDRYPSARMNAAVPDTKKGTVAHLAPPPEAVAMAHEPARIHWILTPRYDPDTHCAAAELPPQQAMGELIQNAFNYEVLGATGFRTAAAIVEQARAHSLRYRSLDAAHAWIDEHLT
jgi:HprK-related kinase A